MPLAAAVQTSKKPIPLVNRYDLITYLNLIWQNHFGDISRVNTVHIDYNYPWKTRLGLIRLSLDESKTYIGINSLLQLEQVPEYVLIVTIAHELAHYAHGFGSPLPRICKHPHANNVVDRELQRRELGDQLRCCNAWIDKYWYSFYDVQRESGWMGIAGTRKSAQR